MEPVAYNMAHKEILAQSCVLLDSSLEANLERPDLLDGIADLYRHAETAYGDGLVLSWSGRSTSALRERGVPVAMMMHRAIQDESESFGRARFAFFHEPIPGFPGNMDLQIMLTIMLQLRTDARVVVALDRNCAQAIWSWNVLLRAGFVPMSMSGEFLTAGSRLIPAADLEEAMERVSVELMTKRFKAQIASRSWGDRLACKWNFVVPGLPEAVEFHIGRLGQTGEQIALAARVPGRARQVCMGDLTFRVPAVSDRLMISTLQRMYRHFYFRLCDIVDTGELYEADAIDYEDLRSSATASGIWEGVATYLAIVSNYVKQYRGAGFDLPRFVTDAAQFRGDQVYFSGDFLRVPILPQSVRLYGTQLTGLLRKRELHSSARLSLLPWLATAAAVGQKITGSDKGIW